MARDRSKSHVKLASPGLVFAAVQNRLLAPAPVPPGLRDGTWTGARSRFWTAAKTKPGEANFTWDLERSRANHGVPP